MVKRAWYRNNVDDFLEQDNDTIIGQLASASTGDGFAVEQTQHDAWRHELQSLKRVLSSRLPCQVFLEFNIPRMGRRIDAVILGPNFPYILVIEFKVGSTNFLKSDIAQVQDYALELKNFHKGSHVSRIIPILVATEAATTNQQIVYADDAIAEPLCVNEAGLKTVLDSLHFEGEIDGIAWESQPYEPTPTIIEAARSLYRNQDIEDITRSEGGSENIKLTSDTVSNIIHRSYAKNEKTIVFVTGVPGAGKTLVGLNIATQHRSQTEDHAVFLSGNGPLVSVLQEALARDEVDRTGVKKNTARTRSKTFIQNVHHFRDEGLRSDRPPSEHVVIFDEAQRAWNQEKTSDFMKRKKNQPDFNVSESEYLISYMDRHEDWATVICLVGGGQEIYTGEAGISAWIEAVLRKFPSWNIAISDQLFDTEYEMPTEVRKKLQSSANVTTFPELHLHVSMRSFRAENVSNFIKALLDINKTTALSHFQSLAPNYPIVLTRDIAVAKKWVRTRARGTERYGMVASSKAMRLRPFAVDVKSDADPVHYFLDGVDDVRSSYFLEAVATEFQIQGLELDWAVVCWDADLRFADDSWSFHDFKGKKWQNIKNQSNQLYLKNAYRVLLTRARQGMAIFIPHGNYPPDESRKSEYYDDIFTYLKSLGIPELEANTTDRGY